MLQTLTSVLSLLIGAAILVIGNSLIGIVLPIRMGIEHIPPEFSGLVMSAFYMGFMLGSWQGQSLVRRAGHIRAFAALAAVLTAAVLVHALVFNVYAWAVLRVLNGFCMAGLYSIIESWLNVRSSNENRGQVLSIYVVTTNAATFGGQFLVNAGSVTGAELFCMAAMLTALSLVPVVLTRVAGPEIDRVRPMSIVALYRASPLGVVATTGTGMISGAFYGLGAVYASEQGWGVFDVSLFMAAPILGGMLLQYPIGRFSDRFDRRSILLIVLLCALASAIALAVLGSAAAPLILMMAASTLFGGFITAIYPIAVSQVFDYIDRSQMVGASGGLLLIWGVGATAGPLIASVAMGQTQPWGLFVYLSVVLASLVVFTRYRMSRRVSLPNDEQTNFVSVQTTSAVAAALDPRAAPLSEFYYDDADPGDR